MSDQKLRELERRWRETKSVDDEAAYLRERVRVGDLTQERLELAARCGHAASAIALGIARITPPKDTASTTAWLKGLPDVPHQILVRAALEATCAGIEIGAASAKRDRLRARVQEAEAATKAVEEWLRCPCHVHENAMFMFTYFGESDSGHKGPADLANALASVVGAQTAQPAPALCPFVEELEHWWRVCRTHKSNNIGQILASVIEREVLS